MCVVSMVGDHYRDMWKPKDWYQPAINPHGVGQAINGFVSRAEFDELKRQVEEMKALLARAKKYDDDNHEPECEVDEKMEILRKVAKLVGVDLDDVLGAKA